MQILLSCSLVGIAMAKPMWDRPGPKDPVVAQDGTIYAPSMDVCMETCGIYALSPDGTLKWKATLPDGFLGSPVLGNNDTVYVATSDTALYSIDEAGLASKFLAGEDDQMDTDAPAIGPDGTLYVLDESLLAAVGPSGNLKWKFNVGSKIEVSAAVNAKTGSVYVMGNGMLNAIDSSGTKKWDMQLKATAGKAGLTESGLAVGADGTIYAAVCNTEGWTTICRVDAVKDIQQGVYTWSREFPATATLDYSPIFTDDGTILVAVGSILYAISPDGSDKWQFAGDNGFQSPSVGPDGSIYVASQPGQLYKLSSQGKQMWTFKPPCPQLYGHPCCSDISKAAIGKDNTVYMEVRVCKDPWVYALNSDGKLKWKWAFNETSVVVV